MLKTRRPRKPDRTYYVRMSVTYTAHWIFPVDASPLERGTITIDEGKIAAIEPHGTRTPDIDLGNVAILPGFVNAHTHLDLTGTRGLCPPSPDFTQWLRSVIAYRRARTPEQVQSDIAAGIAACVRYGTTLIGDISSGGGSWDLLTRSPCRAVVFRELLGLTEARADESLRDAASWLHSDARRGLSPHSPYSVRSTVYSVLSTQRAPIATHLAETQAELQLLRDRKGPFVDLLKELGVWDPSGLIAGHVDVIRALPRGIFVHCNYLPPNTPFTALQSVVVCPRTHAAFGHPRHPFPQMKVRVALGTDSLASNPDLDILAEARFLRQNYPEIEPATLLRMLTLNGAEALVSDAVAGSLTPEKSADLVVLKLPDADERDPHDLVLRSTTPVERVMFRGAFLPMAQKSLP